jgi:predicted dehydrogenase
VRRAGEKEGHVEEAAHPGAPYDDPLHYLAAVIRGSVAEEDSVSSLKTNLTVSEILDAARQSAQSGRSVKLPLRP